MLAELIRRVWLQNRNVLVIGKFVAHLQDLMDLCEGLGIPKADMGQYTGERLIRRMVVGERGPRMETVKRIKLKRSEYEKVKRDAKIIFATYGVFKEGIDVPRLDCGIDVLPQSEATQVIGRIRRPQSGKPMPYWITTLDVACPISKRMFEARCREYQSTGCRIVESNRI